MSNQDCNCEQSERLKKELKQTKAERDNAEETWNNERKMYQAACVERDEARRVAVRLANGLFNVEKFMCDLDGHNEEDRVERDFKLAAEVSKNWGKK